MLNYVWNGTYIACKSCTTITIWYKGVCWRERERERERVGGNGNGNGVLCVWSIDHHHPTELQLHNPDESQKTKPAAKKNTWKTLNLPHKSITSTTFQELFEFPTLNSQIVDCDDDVKSFVNSTMCCWKKKKKKKYKCRYKRMEPTSLQFNSIQFNSMTLSDDDDDASREKGEKKRKNNYNKHLKLLCACANNQS